MPLTIKICGITTVDDALDVARRGGDFVGLNFYPRSPRHLAEDSARKILAALPSTLLPVGLFVNEPWERIEAAARRLGLTRVQIHGDRLQPCPVAGLRWIPAFAVRDASSLEEITAFVKRCPAERCPAAVLVDAHVPGAYGGTGQMAPWHLLAGFDPGVPVILAGGLTPENVADAVRTVRPWGVDVAGGVESSPGKKDPARLERFITNARGV
jgi:phosphoribosylanthranilate isomerase